MTLERLRSLASDRGTAGVGLAAGATALIMLAMLAAGGLRLVAVTAAVAGAADAAADAAARTRTATDAAMVADSVVAEQLGSGRARCRTRTVSVESDGVSTGEPTGPEPAGLEPIPGAGPTLVRVRVRCEIDLSAVVLVGFPGSVVVERGSVEPVDRFRGGGSP